MSDHRKPPLPPWFERPRQGCCRWCNLPVYSGRACWHEECLRIYSIAAMHNPVWHLLRIGQGGSYFAECAACGLASGWGDFELDHIVPLCLRHDCISCWLPANLQLLCPPCHRAKTRRDLAEWRSRGRSVAQGSAGLFGAVN